jgi:hypothetical protein
MRFTPTFLVFLSIVLVPTSASAAVRYAAPASVDAAGACAGEDTACTLPHAINDGAAGDEIVVLPGTYTVTTLLSVKADTNVHGKDGAARPVINTTQQINLLGSTTSGVFRGIDVTGSNQHVFTVATKNLIDDVTVLGSGNNGDAIYVNAAEVTISDTVAQASGTSSTGIFAAPTTVGSRGNVSLRNVTVNAYGPNGVGVVALTNVFDLGPPIGCLSIGAAAVGLTNSVVRGTSFDLATRIQGVGACAVMSTIDSMYSNWRIAKKSEGFGPITSGTGDQTTDALTDTSTIFVGFAAGNLHTLSGSPTLDAGTASGANSFDAASNTRTLGPAIDIGAYEAPAPTTSTLQSVVLAPTRANLSAVVTQDGTSMTGFFEYGLTTAYGATTPPLAVGTNSLSHTAAASLTGLTASKTYHYRFVSDSDNGSQRRTFSADKTFSTFVPSVALTKVRVALTKKGVVSVNTGFKVKCPASGPTYCKGTANVKYGKKLLGSVKFSIRKGRTTTPKVHLTKAGKKLLKKKHKLKVKLSETTAISGAGSLTRSRTAFIRFP